MKRSLADTSTRSTAGCLPVPLFNQKKRTRQPLTSNPLKNEPGTGSGTRTYDFSPTSFGWGTANPEVAELQKAANSGNRNEYNPLSNPADPRPDSGITQKFGNLSNSWKTVQQPKNPGNRNSSQLLKTETSQPNTPKGQWPVKPNPASRSLQGHSPAYKFNSNIQQNKMNEDQFDFVPEEKIQEVPSSQIKMREKKNSLRILSAVIESLRHWSQYSYKTALLFEVLGTLDSAVTPGAYGAKNFLLRDGKETLPCVFYEIARGDDAAGASEGKSPSQHKEHPQHISQSLILNQLHLLGVPSRGGSPQTWALSSWQLHLGSDITQTRRSWR
ncbi:spermatogenesis-associated protein 22 isoform X3 [Empidonax traillii]|uniref:spermatogenesis-associated protein 22 isoform X3 n=1 Tax=Empidonax traillii TaxID=164674 RepID=UPI000FFD8E58|nr:spermatogenesis-associated protein 22 isoform X3 [Empidonax traillii]